MAYNKTKFHLWPGDKWVANKPLDVTGNLETTAITIGGVAFDEKVDDRVSNLLTGEGIDLTYNDGTNELTVAVRISNSHKCWCCIIRLRSIYP